MSSKLRCGYKIKPPKILIAKKIFVYNQTNFGNNNNKKKRNIQNDAIQFIVHADLQVICPCSIKCSYRFGFISKSRFAKDGTR